MVGVETGAAPGRDRTLVGTLHDATLTPEKTAA